MEPFRPKVEQLDPVSTHPIGPTYKYIGLDNAKTLYRALEVLPEHTRLEWLNWCCKKASEGEPLTFRVLIKPQDIKEYLVNLYQLIGHGSLTMEIAIQCAENLARKAW